MSTVPIRFFDAAGVLLTDDMPVVKPTVIWSSAGPVNGAHDPGLNCAALVSAIEAVIERNVLSLTHIATGGFHSIILVNLSDKREIIARAACPQMVESVRQGDSAAGHAWYLEHMDREAALLSYLHLHTSIPVPSVLHISSDDRVGAPWMLMTKCEGIPLDHIYAGITMEAKREIVSQMARYTVELFNLHLPSGIGTLCTLSPGTESLALSPPLCAFPAPASSPFSSLEAYILHLLDWLPKSSSMVGQEPEQIRAAERVCARLKEALPAILPPQDCIRQTTVWHLDMELRNVHGTKDGTVLAVLDWEGYLVLPSLVGVQYPDWIRYDGAQDPRFQGRHKPTERFWEHTREEAQRLRDVFAATIQSLSPACYRDLLANQECKQLLGFLHGGADPGLEGLGSWLESVLDGTL